jgi:hypothetical protein
MYLLSLSYHFLRDCASSPDNFPFPLSGSGAVQFRFSCRGIPLRVPFFWAATRDRPYKDIETNQTAPLFFVSPA